MNKKTGKLLVCVNGNDGQFRQMRLFCKTLLASNKGAFKGDICILSTELSVEKQKYFKQRGILIHIDKLEWLFDLPIARKIGMFELIAQECRAFIDLARNYNKECDNIDFTRLLNSSAIALFQAALRKDKHNLCWEKKGKRAFSIYRNKHFSKLGLLSFLKSCGGNYAKILLCDGDMIFQQPVIKLFDEVKDSCIYVRNEVDTILPGSHIYRSNKLADNYPPIKGKLAMGLNAHELNVGVLLGKTDSITKLLRDWRKLMFESELQGLFIAHPSDFWHEQDFMRLFRDTHLKRFKSLKNEDVVHLCSHGYTIVQEKNGCFRLKSTKQIPVIIHFAGGTWSKYPTIRRVYASS